MQTEKRWIVDVQRERLSRMALANQAMILRELGFKFGKTFQTKEQATQYAENFTRASRIQLRVLEI